MKPIAASPCTLPSQIRFFIIFFSLVILSLFGCKKTDVRPAAPGDAIATKKNPDAHGNLHTRVVNNSLNFPWEILWGPDNMIWMTEREGRVSRVNPQTGQVILVAAIPDVASTTNFNGLLGMALHPQFSTSPFVYVIYNYFSPSGAYLEKIVRFTYNGTTLVSPMTLVDGIVGKIGGDFIHNGARLVIGPDMKLYASTGDADRRFEFPQNPNSLNGKILRVNLDGTIPADNPFGNVVWAIGMRNPQGLVFGKGKLYNSMHGESTNDEINIILRGRNYGWPFVEGFCDKPAEQSFCAANNVVEPIYAWTPTIAPSGLDYYNNNAIAQWKNSLLLAVLKDKKLIQLKLNDGGTRVEEVHEYFTNQFGRLRDVAQSPDGKVYFCTDNGNHSDMIVEITKGNRKEED
jgi:glucose/arabinose dehydrogenase